MKKLEGILLASLVLVLAGPALAADATMPQAGEPRAYHLPAIEQVTLGNGMKVTLVPFGNVPKVSIGLRIRAGNLNEGGKTWLADLTAEMLKEGTIRRSSREVAEDAAGMGGELNISAGQDETSLGLDVLSETAGDAVRLLAQVIMSPALPASEISRLRQNLVRALKVRQSNPRPLAEAAFVEHLYGDHPYGRFFPSEAALLSYGIADVEAFYRDNFGAARSHIYIVGRFDRAAVLAALHDSFDGWAPGPKPLVLPPKPSTGARLILIDRPGAPQSSLLLGLPVPDPTDRDYVRLQVMNTLLGGSFGSRITTNIREEKGYTYSPFASIRTHYHDAYWAERADVTTGVTGPALHEIFGEVKRLQETAPADSELSRYKNYLAGIHVLRNAGRGGLINQLARLDLQGLDYSELETYTGRVYAVTPVEVQAMAARYLPVDRMILAIVGDLQVVRPQLMKLVPLAGLLADE